MVHTHIYYPIMYRTSSRSTPSTLVHTKTIHPGEVIEGPPGSELSTPRSGKYQPAE